MKQWALLLNVIFELFEKMLFGMQRLVALFVIAIFTTLFLAQGAWAGVLFQSPTSPPVEPVDPTQAEPLVPNEAVEDPFFPDEQPEEIFVEPVEPVPIDQAADPNQPVIEPVSPISPEQQTGDAPPPAFEPPAEEEDRPLRLERDDEFAEADEEGSRNFILDQAELIDTVVVSTAYIWLCCGIGLFLLIPLVFLFLQIRGGTKIRREEIY